MLQMIFLTLIKKIADLFNRGVKLETEFRDFMKKSGNSSRFIFIVIKDLCDRETGFSMEI